MHQCPWTHAATVSGWASSIGAEQIRHTISTLRLPLTVVARLIRNTWAQPGNSIQAGLTRAFTVRVTVLPCPRSVSDRPETSLHGRAANSSRKPGWLPLTVRT
jgi:hypothetical protein